MLLFFSFFLILALSSKVKEKYAQDHQIIISSQLYEMKTKKDVYVRCVCV